MKTGYKYLIAIGAALAAGLIAFAAVHPDPPTTLKDWWTLLIVTLTSAGLGAAGKGATAAIDNSITQKTQL